MELERWLSEIDYPMFIATTAAQGERSGCLVGFITQCSIDPLRFIVCLSDKNHTYRVAQHAEVLGIHLVPADAEELAELFGSESGDEVDKFARCEWREGPAGVPLLDECPNWFAGGILSRMAVGDHAAFLVEPVDSGAGVDESQFDYHQAKRLSPGHEA